MKTETLLDAMELAKFESKWCPLEKALKRRRQYNAIRERILRMDAELRNQLAFERNAVQVLGKQLAEKEEENQRLREALKDFNWSHYDVKQGDHYCLICDANKADGKHKPDCPMGGVE
jgi:hypothetical protein